MSDGNTTPKRTLKQLREARGLTREELAVALKVPFSTLVNIETGRNRPRIELAEKIYEFFNMPVGSIEWGKKVAVSKTMPTAA